MVLSMKTKISDVNHHIILITFYTFLSFIFESESYCNYLRKWSHCNIVIGSSIAYWKTNPKTFKSYPTHLNVTESMDG